MLLLEIRQKKIFLKAIRRIDQLLDSELLIETEGYQKGSLVSDFNFCGVILTFLAPSINDIMVH